MKHILIILVSCIVVFNCNKLDAPVQPKEYFSLIISFPAGYRHYVECVSGDTVGFAVPTDTNKMQLDYYNDFNSASNNTYCLSFIQTFYGYDTQTQDTLEIQIGQALWYFRMKLY